MISKSSRIKKFFAICAMCVFVAACNGDSEESASNVSQDMLDDTPAMEDESSDEGADVPSVAEPDVTDGSSGGDLDAPDATEDSPGVDVPVVATDMTEPDGNPPTVETTAGRCVDTFPENDGWGWDGVNSCRVQPGSDSQVPGDALQQITDVVLVTGQSNTLGSNTDVVEGLDDPSSRVYAWTENGWDVANLRQVWDLGWHPRTTPDGLHPHNNFALHFGKQVASASDRVVAFIVLSAPGRPISHWDIEKDFYQKIRFQVVEALSFLPHISELNAILWHQGENNWFGGAEYREKLYQLIANFRGEPWYGERAFFICGETHRAPVNADLDSLNSDGDIRTACVSSLGVGVLPDLTHFDSAGLREIGKRYGEKYLNLYNGDTSSQ